MERTLVVPVRMSTAGTLALRTGRLPSGERVGLAFTSESSLARALGPSQECVCLAFKALMDMLPLGIQRIRVDPYRAGDPHAHPAPQQW
jgi:SseB protein N-terminal domain